MKPEDRDAIKFLAVCLLGALGAGVSAALFGFAWLTVKGVL